MTPNALRQELTRLSLTQNGLARALAVDARLARRWASGDAHIPQSVALLLQRLTPADAARLVAVARERA